MSAATTAYPPIFVGGTGRSGTTILGHLIGAHPQVYCIPVELKFHSAAVGLPGVVRGDVELPAFLERMDYWWFHTLRNGAERGIRGVWQSKREEFDRMLESFEAGFGRDREQAARTLLAETLATALRRSGKPQLVEQTPTNVEEAVFLRRLYPECKVVHIRRDGRDVAASVTEQPWGPDDAERAVRSWAERLAACEEQMREIGDGLTIDFESLFTEREETYERLLSYLELEDAPEIRAYLEREVNLERANIGRWKQHAEAEEIDRLVSAARSS